MILKIEHGGWCPQGRLAEDGTIPSQYNLAETASSEYPERTERNVIDSDGTLILYRAKLQGGTKLTHKMARHHQRPFLLVDLDQCLGPVFVQQWLNESHIETLNVAGPRESGARGIGGQTQDFLLEVLREA